MKILTKGLLEVREAAIVRAGSRHRNIAPNNINLPILLRQKDILNSVLLNWLLN